MRRFRQVIVWLIVGMVLNVAIAWGVAWARTPSETPTAEEVRRIIEEFNQREVSGIGYQITKTEDPDRRFATYLFGWPFKGMMRLEIHERSDASASGEWIKEGWLVRFWQPPRLDRHELRAGHVQLPTRPTLAAGVNVVILGALVWTTCWLVASTRVWNRRRLGICPACRYDLSGLDGACPCPECGAMG